MFSPFPQGHGRRVSAAEKEEAIIFRRPSYTSIQVWLAVLDKRRTGAAHLMMPFHNLVIS
jgi:hypothetical protein